MLRRGCRGPFVQYRRHVCNAARQTGSKHRSVKALAAVSTAGVACYVATTNRQERRKQVVHCDDGALMGAVVGAACGVGLSYVAAKFLGKDAAQAFMEAQRASLPDRVILVRHGESEANADHTLWRSKADNLIALSSKGHDQAEEAGKRIREIIGDETVGFYVSPFWRTLQTFKGIAKAFKDRLHDAIGQHGEYGECWVRLESNIREQEMGSNFANLQGDEAQQCRIQQREVIGRFYYRFPTGESGADVYHRAKSWWHSDLLNVNLRHAIPPVENVVVITHGLTMRFILMAIEHWSVNTFETVWNGDNCAIWVLKKDLSLPGPSPYRLDTSEGDKVVSSRKVWVTFKDKGPNGQKSEMFDLQDYLSIPQPRTKHIEVVAKFLAAQNPGVNADDIVHVNFYAETPGSLSHLVRQKSRRK